eukprot:Rmarinus@m.30197
MKLKTLELIPVIDVTIRTLPRRCVRVSKETMICAGSLCVGLASAYQSLRIKLSGYVALCVMTSTQPGCAECTMTQMFWLLAEERLALMSQRRLCECSLLLASKEVDMQTASLRSTHLRKHVHEKTCSSENIFMRKHVHEKTCSSENIFMRKHVHEK